MLLIKLARTEHTSQTDQPKSVTMETEELYDDDLIDEIADEVLLSLEEERPDETCDGEVNQWAEACQAELAQLLDGAIGAAPPPAIPTEPALPPLCHQAGTKYVICSTSSSKRGCMTRLRP